MEKKIWCNPHAQAMRRLISVLWRRESRYQGSTSIWTKEERRDEGWPHARGTTMLTVTRRVELGPVRVSIKDPILLQQKYAVAI